MLSELYSLFHHNEIPYLRQIIKLFISASEVGTILIPWNLQRNASFIKEVGSSFTTRCKFKFSAIETKKLLRTSEKRASAQLNVFSQTPLLLYSMLLLSDLAIGLL